jgi:hypothetical protein
MKRLIAAACAVLAALPATVLGGPADEIQGTWECRLPGAAATKTPPIVWFGAARSGGQMVETAVDLDGFARQVSGISDLSSDPDGWLRVQPQDGPAFMVKPHGLTNKQGLHAMSLRRGGASYRCLRLPLIV